jgi:hypothetical protein
VCVLCFVCVCVYGKSGAYLWYSERSRCVTGAVVGGSGRGMGKTFDTTIRNTTPLTHPTSTHSLMPNTQSHRHRDKRLAGKRAPLAYPFSLQ